MDAGTARKESIMSSRSEQAVVVYESLYGNTRAVAEAVGAGLAETMPVRVLPVADAGPDQLAGVSLLVVGAPTHVRGMSRPNTRTAAVQAAAAPDSGVTVEAGWRDTGVREWLTTVAAAPTWVASFDTRIKTPLGLSGSAAHRVAKRLEHSGFTFAVPPMGFYVTKHNRLVAGELERARDWGRSIAAATAAAAVTT